MDIISMLLESLKSIAILLVISGLLMAFLWKIAFYVQLGLGLIVTLIATYFVYQFNLGIQLVFLVFIIGLVATLIAAFLAAIMAIVNGFLLTWFGIFLYMIRGQVFDLSRLSGQFGNNLLGSAVIAVILVATSAFAGGYLFRMPSLKFRSGKKIKLGEEPEGQKQKHPIEPFEETRVVRLDHPTSASCGFCRDEWAIDSEVYKCTKCKTNFHHDCIEEYLKKSQKCPKCQRKAGLPLLD